MHIHWDEYWTIYEKSNFIFQNNSMTNLLRTGVLGYWQKSVWLWAAVRSTETYYEMGVNIEEILYTRNINVKLNKGT